MMARALELLGRINETEKARAELIFAAILGGDETLPSFASLDKTTFWTAIETRTAADFGVGLRAMVHAIDLAPLLMAGFRRPFHSLSPSQRAGCIEALARDQRYLVRQALSALKILACFAWFDAETVRARYADPAIPSLPTSAAPRP